MRSAMMKITKYMFLLTGIIVSTPCFNQGNQIATKNTIKLQIIEVGWSSKPWEKTSPDTSLIIVKEGMAFGGKDTPYYFRLLEIIDTNSIKVLFSNDLVIVGEPINFPSSQNPVVIYDEKQCFRLRHFDAGSDYCIEILKNQ